MSEKDNRERNGDAKAGTDTNTKSDRDRRPRAGRYRARTRPSRRRFMQAAAATGAVAGLGGVGSAQEDEDDDDDEDGAEGDYYFELGGESSRWVGLAPEEIEDETNPTLVLEEGETYELVWENLDGIGHNFVIIDEDGEQLVRTDIMTGEGETQSVEFEAAEEMAEYYCEPHPQTMRGDIAFDDVEEEAPDEEEAEPYFPEGPTVGVEPVAEGLIAPTDFDDPEGSDYQYVSDQTGEIWAIDENGVDLEGDPFLDISDRMVAVAEEFAGGYADPEGDYDERGLLGIEFHPDYEENGRFVVNYSAPPDEETPDGWSHVQVIAEFEADDDDSADPDSERRLLEIQHPQYNHDSGPMAFGPDGYLYVPMGDGGGGNDSDYGHVEDWYDENEGGNGQDTTENLLGGIHRIDIDNEGENGEPYAIPEDNPFAEGEELEGEGLEEYFAWGLRNPFGITFSGDDRLIVADAGQVLFEAAYEIEKGGNYGWNVREGSHCFSTDTPATPPEECPTETPDDVRGGEPLIDPVVEYPQVYQDQGVGIVIIGGHTYEDDTIEELEGKYVFGDWTRDQGRQIPDGRVFAATPEDLEETEERDEAGGRPRDDLWEMEEVLFDGSEDGQLHHFVRQFGRGADGEVYVIANQVGIPAGDTGVVLEIVPAGEGMEIEPPEEAPEDVDDDEVEADDEDEDEDEEQDEHPGDEDEDPEPEDEDDENENEGEDNDSE
ncbi:PQQ-dependent sugar dehydrogenase [Natronoglomus mannanivorans]|uniref:PQQ-dependent sugar dehydrogenase n=1 Tax=Natronoglomus mannanivorans TaxID=2979990 RepID=A0AAP3E3K8_9EURY|nr:PQQ-dependent sugar dehydrogenase [Halobacteria archaeon AArc-xg1-1]